MSNLLTEDEVTNSAILIKRSGTIIDLRLGKHLRTNKEGSGIATRVWGNCPPPTFAKIVLKIPLKAMSK